MKKLFLTLVSIFVCSSLAFCSYVEEAYIFDVGQGNCQFFRYGNVGVLYDAGSSTSRTFSKVKPLKREDFEYFITKKLNIMDESYSIDTKEENVNNYSQISQNFFKGLKGTSEFTDKKKKKIADIRKKR